MKFPAPQTNGRCFCAFRIVEVDSTDEIARLALPRDFGFWWRQRDEVPRYTFGTSSTRLPCLLFALVSECLSLSFVIAWVQYTREAVWELFVTSVDSERAV